MAGSAGRGAAASTLFRKTVFIGRPFLLFENGKAAYAFFATSNGEDDFMTAQGTWNMVIPLKESE